MRILVITRNAWDDTNAIGNTLSNFLNGIENAEFASIYFRGSKPNNKLCKRYYHTSEIEVVKKWFKPSNIGHYFTSAEVADTTKGKSKEKTLIRAIQKYGIKMAYKVSDRLWYSEKWINKKLDAFIEEFKPDLMVTFVKSAPQYYLTVKHIKEKYNVPLFSWIADDEYTTLLRKKSKREINNLKYIINESAKVTGCSEELCEYYNAVFGCHAEILYKGCDLSTPFKDKNNEKLTIVYAGNLLYGRLEIISRFANSLKKSAEHSAKIIFEVYSNTNLLESEIQANFGDDKIVKYMGRRDYGFIKERLTEADVVLHVESFDEDQILKTKYSFSTKIVDYLQSGSVILAIGPSEISSIKYISKIPGAYVINDMERLSEELEHFLSKAPKFYEMASSTRRFAHLHHDSRVLSQKMNEAFKNILEGGV